jgi:hypothetical protein
MGAPNFIKKMQSDERKCNQMQCQTLKMLENVGKNATPKAKNHKMSHKTGKNGL